MIDLILNRHSYRGTYLPTPVPRQHLKTILEAGLAAPSGCNKQTTSLIARTAPAFIAVLTQKIYAYRDKCFQVQDYSAAIENMLLAIKALGYESCWYEGHITDEDDIAGKLARILDVPPEYRLVCILPVGIAAEKPGAPSKKPFEERAWFNGFGKRE